ncbi:hypothetical protein DFH09DRAFT_1159673 [Mycena vulgaris]|nr:hypothetical protein DFH09DRAFT_1159673 [Mycena vulgaris]
MSALISSWSWIAAPVSPNLLSMSSLALRPASCPSCSGVRLVLGAGKGSSGFVVAVAATAAAEDEAAAIDATMSMPAAASAACADLASAASCATCSSCASLLPNPGGIPVLVCSSDRSRPESSRLWIGSAATEPSARAATKRLNVLTMVVCVGIKVEVGVKENSVELRKSIRE